MVVYSKLQLDQWEREDERMDRQLTPEQRITLALQLFELGRQIRLAGLRLEYPDASPEELQSVFIRELDEARQEERSE